MKKTLICLVVIPMLFSHGLLAAANGCNPASGTKSGCEKIVEKEKIKANARKSILKAFKFKKKSIKHADVL